MTNDKTQPTIANVALVAKTYYDYSCSVEVVGKTPNPEELQKIADSVYGLVDGGEYEADEHNWDLVEARAEIVGETKARPRYRAVWIGKGFRVEENNAQSG